MNTNTAEGDLNSGEDILDGLFESEEGHPNPDGDVTPNIKSYLAIDEKFKDLPPDEGLARTIQSREEGLKYQLNSEVTRAEELSGQVRFLDQLKEDPELRQAWLGEVDPDSAVDTD